MKTFLKWALRVIIAPVIAALVIIQKALKWISAIWLTVIILLGGIGILIGVICYFADFATKGELITIILYFLKALILPVIAGFTAAILELLNRAALSKLTNIPQDRLFDDENIRKDTPKWP